MKVLNLDRIVTLLAADRTTLGRIDKFSDKPVRSIDPNRLTSHLHLGAIILGL